MTAHELGLRPQPVRNAINVVTGSVTLALAAIPLLQAFDLIHWTAIQVGAVQAFAGVLVAAIGGKIATDYARARVTPLESPQDIDGNRLVPVYTPEHLKPDA